MKSNHKTKILVVGSIGIDTIFSVHGSLKEKIQIKKGKLLKQNLMFVANEKKEFDGGTGGNIAYGLGLTGVKPLLFSIAGKDFPFVYEKKLKKNGVQSRVVIDKNHWTANFYGITDYKNEQIGIWQPNVYITVENTLLLDTCKPSELKSVSVAIFSPGTPTSTFKHMLELRNYSSDAAIIFDPGQMVMTYSKRLLETCISLSNIVIVNEIEYTQASTVLGSPLENISGKYQKTLIVTFGASGSRIFSPVSIISVKAIKPKKLVDPTGAGDAYRAGLIYALSKGFSIEKGCKIGTKMASRCIETEGCQTYTFKNS